MPRVNGIVSFRGSYEDMTFYHKDGKSYVRKRTEIPKERILSDPQFVRTRENMSEFSTNIDAAKLLRHSLGSLVYKAKDSRLSNRLMSAMSKIKNLDVNSGRGRRTVIAGLGMEEGKRYLKGFDFNEDAPLDTVLSANYTLDNANGKIVIPGLIPGEQVHVPEFANFVSFQCGVLNVEFDTGLSDLVLSPVTNLAIDLNPTDVTLSPPSMPAGNGTVFYILMISFYQDIGGVQYSLKSKNINVLQIVDVV